MSFCEWYLPQLNGILFKNSVETVDMGMFFGWIPIQLIILILFSSLLTWWLHSFVIESENRKINLKNLQEKHCGICCNCVDNQHCHQFFHRNAMNSNNDIRFEREAHSNTSFSTDSKAQEKTTLDQHPKRIAPASVRVIVRKK